MFSRVINAVNAPFASSASTGVATSSAYYIEDAIAWTVSGITSSGLTSSILTVETSNDTVERREPISVRAGTWSIATAMVVDGTGLPFEGPPGVRFVRFIRDTSVAGVEQQPIFNKLVG
jgi:hypothetical protein